MPYSALNSNFWRLNFENPSIGSRVMWPQHYDIQTYRQTDRQTYIHTDRQTEPKYDIDISIIVLLFVKSSFDYDLYHILVPSVCLYVCMSVCMYVCHNVVAT